MENNNYYLAWDKLTDKQKEEVTRLLELSTLFIKIDKKSPALRYKIRVTTGEILGLFIPNEMI
jgi:hypothetical protein